MPQREILKSLPPPKPDLDTIHGRLQDARQRRGFTREDFAALMGYTIHGWTKIELGVNALSADGLKKANQELKLDERYFFGKLSYEDAQCERVATVEEVDRKLSRLAALADGQSSSVAGALERPMIRRIVARLKDLGDSRLGRIVERMDAYLDGIEENDPSVIRNGSGHSER